MDEYDVHRLAMSNEPLNKSLEPKGQCNLKIHGIIHTWRRGSFRTALMLSRDVAPSGQSNLPLLTNFSAGLLNQQLRIDKQIEK